MGCEVYANGMTIACKAASGQTAAAMPDVCLSPPSPPAGPIPIPYPNTAMASDATKGSKTVQINGQEVMLKNKSTFKKSTGDEAATKSLGMGVVSHQIQGEVNFVAWSMDVKFEGENVPRHLDMTLHNEMCTPANTPPWPYVDSSAFADIKKCEGDKKAMDRACKGKEPCPNMLGAPVGEQRALFEKGGDVSRTMQAGTQATADADGSKCVQKSRCYLRPYKPESGQDGCCPGQTPHHIPPKQCLAGVKGYKMEKALCVCMEGANQHTGSHGKNHAAIEYLADKKGLKDGSPCNLGEYNKMCATAVAQQCGCNQDCIEQQLNQSFKDPKNTEIKHVDTNSSSPLEGLDAKLDKALKAAKQTASSGR